MTTVNDEQGIPANDIKTAGPADIPNAFVDIFFGDIPALFHQCFRNGQHNRSVVELVITQQRQLDVLPLAAIEDLTEQIQGFQLQILEVCLLQRSILLSADFFKDSFYGRNCAIDNCVAAFLDDASLGVCDFFQCIAQQFGVIQTDVGDNSNFGHLDDVGSVIFAAQTDFQNDDVALLALEVFKRNAANQFELCGRFFHSVSQRLNVFCNRNDILIADLLTVDLHTLMETVNIGRGVQTGAVTCLLQNRCSHSSGTTLAVGAGDMDIL